MVVCDNNFLLYLNGKKVGQGDDYTKPYFFDISKRLKKGQNLFSVKAVNALPGNVEPKEGELVPGSENPAGFLFYARLRDGTNVMDLVSDNSWTWSPQMKEWIQVEVTAGKWHPAHELGEISMAPWKLAGDFVQKMFAGVQLGRVRSALVAADSLQIALGRPNREQVVTTRATAATTLQALELTNGADLANLLKRGAERVLSENGSVPGRELVRQLYFKALGREPSAKEMQLARELVGEKPEMAGVEDLMWSIAMLPEFQLIY